MVVDSRQGFFDALLVMRILKVEYKCFFYCNVTATFSTVFENHRKGRIEHWVSITALASLVFPWRKETFFHFSGNSLRRVHVSIRLLEKTYHHFFEPKMGVSTPSAPFQQKKRPKKAKKNFKQREEKKFSHPCEGNFLRRDGKNIFLPAL